MVCCQLVIAAVIAAVVISYLWSRKRYRYWIERDVPQGNPVFLLGDSWRMILRKQSVPEMVENFYNISPDARYVGIYQFLRPQLVLRDPDLIKQMVVKDFDHFVNRQGFISEDEPILGKSLKSLENQKWKDMRSTLSPTFTSSKMKYMFSLISETGQQFTNHFLKKNEDVVTIEMKDSFSKFANDIIANAAFGIKCDSLEDPDNEFYLMGKESSDFVSFSIFLKFMLLFISKPLFKFFRLSFFPAKMGEFFLKLVKENIASREEQNIVRPDMIQLLMETRKHGLKHEETQITPEAGFIVVEESEIGKNEKVEKLELTDEIITAQAFMFFLAGFETVSTFTSFLSYELAVNPDIQEKLRQEILQTLNLCQNKLTYEALTKMKYMDMVVSEGLRKWPNGIALDRICTKPYTIEPQLPNEKPVHLEKGFNIIIPLYALHRDPQYFPDPERFDPERFNNENKKNIKPYTFFPFGLGPRGCIGYRFALLEMKSLFFYLLADFEIVPVEKTQIPLKLSKKAMNMTAEKDIWLGLKRRVK